jgi:hypothetical protein
MEIRRPRESGFEKSRVANARRSAVLGKLSVMDGFDHRPQDPARLFHL